MDGLLMAAIDQVWVPSHDDPGADAFWLWVICVNWGRGYDPKRFRSLIWNVIAKTKGKAHVAILAQEVDEADPAPEHQVLADALESGTHKAGWGTHEPILLSPAFDVSRERVTVTMEAGLKLRPPAPAGTGPTRHAVTCVAEDEGLKVGFGNTHPHRNMPAKTVQHARAEGAQVFRDELQQCTNSSGGIPIVWGADANDSHFPQMLAGEKSAIHRGLDYIRYRDSTRGAHLELMNTGTLEGRIDPHDPLWALFRVSARQTNEEKP